jgi:hypothetical protein
MGSMIMFHRNPSALIVAVLLLAGASVSAFSPPRPHGACQASARISHSSSSPFVMKPLFMTDPVPASAKQGSGSAEDQCAPEEGEYCIVDAKSGKLIQLTLQEKERIFLDALQVRQL